MSSSGETTPQRSTDTMCYKFGCFRGN